MGNKETIEEAAKEFANNSAVTNYEEGINVGKYQGFINGAKWQQERSYSEEDMKECYEFAMENVQIGRNGYEWVTFKEWFKQFKKK